MKSSGNWASLTLRLVKKSLAVTYSGITRAGFFETPSAIFLQSLVSDLCTTKSTSSVNAIDSAAGTGSVPCAGALDRVFRPAMYLCTTGHAGELCLGKEKS